MFNARDLSVAEADDLIGTLADGPAQVAVLPQTRHVPHRDRVTQVLDLVTRFLASQG